MQETGSWPWLQPALVYRETYGGGRDFIAGRKSLGVCAGQGEDVGIFGRTSVQTGVGVVARAGGQEQHTRQRCEENRHHTNSPASPARRGQGERDQSQSGESQPQTAKA